MAWRYVLKQLNQQLPTYYIFQQLKMRDYELKLQFKASLFITHEYTYMYVGT
jgi:hypothetical protein